MAEQHVGGGNLTLTQEYGSEAFQYGDADTSNLLPLISSTGALARTQAERFGENPMYGMTEFLWELLGKENGGTPSNVAMRLVTGNNAQAATTIAQNDKGTSRYNNAIAQATDLIANPPSAGQDWRTFGTCWYQGEGDTGYSYYLGRLQDLARDYAADLRTAIPLQDFDPLLVTGQPTSDGDDGSRWSVSRAIFRAVADAEDGVIPSGHTKAPPLAFSTPNYFMDFRYDTNGVHVKARDAKWLGGYVALVFKRIFIDGGTFPLMRPINLTIDSGAVLIQFQLRVPGTQLVVAESTAAGYTWDGGSLPPQAGRGFSAVDSGDNPITWSQLPDIVGTDTIRLIPSVDPSNIARIDYAQQDTSYMHPFNGTAGNFRDDYGDQVFYDAINRPMHNWMPLFSIEPAANAAGFIFPT